MWSYYFVLSVKTKEVSGLAVDLDKSSMLAKEIQSQSWQKTGCQFYPNISLLSVCLSSISTLAQSMSIPTFRQPKHYNSQDHCDYCCKICCLCAVSSCCSRFLDCLSQVLDSYLPKMSGFELLKSVYCLCLLGHFPPAPLEKLLQSSTLEQLSNTGKTVNSHICTVFFHFSFFCFISSFCVSSQNRSFATTRKDSFRSWTCASILTVPVSLSP